MRPRYILLLSLCLLEVGALSFRLDTPVQSRGWLRFLDNADVIAHIGVVFIGALSYQLLQAAPHLSIQPQRQHPWWAWLATHLTLFGLFYAWGLTVLAAAPLNDFDIFLWLFVGLMSAAALAFCFQPPIVLFSLIRRHSQLLLLSLAVAFAAWLLGKALQQLWQPLAEATFRMTFQLLHITGLKVVHWPDEGIIGTDQFVVEIAPQCSGYEGIGLIIVFVSLYLFLFRHDFKFPNALLVYPIGISAIFVVNSLRLSGLILLGHFASAEDAIRVFHSQAGWTLFTLLSLSLLAISRKLAFLTTVPSAPIEAHAPSRLAFALLVPFLVLLGSSMVTSTISADTRWSDPLVIASAAATLWHCRATYRALSWSWSWQSVAIGVAVFIVWIALVHGDPERDASRAAALRDMLDWVAFEWIILRGVRSVLIVPIIEELAFRGYLLRKLISRNFETVPVGQFTWPALITSSMLFGLLHEHWVAGMLAGMAYAFAQRQCRSIGGAVIAHGVTNGLIAAVVVIEREWSLWP